MEDSISPFDGGSVEALHIAVIAGVCGYLVFCISHAFAIWRKRQQAGNGGKRLFPWQLLIGLSVVLIAVGWLEREMTRRSGVVLGSDFYVVKADSTSHPHLLDATQVGENDVVVRFDGVELESSYRRLFHDIQIKEREIAVLELSPIEVNPALLARKQEAVEDLRSTMVQLGLGSGATERANLDNMIEGFQSVFSAVLKDREQQLARVRTLYEKGLTSKRELEQASEAVMLAKRDLNRRQHEIAAAKEERKAVIASKQAIAEDQQRARSKRAEEIAVRRAELEKLRQLLLQVERKREVRSPFSGRVVYRHPAPSLASAGQPIMAIAAGEGFVARVQVPAHEALLLAPGDKLRLRLKNATVSEYIMGSLSRVLPVPEQPAFRYLEIVTQLPVEQFANLSYGVVRVNLEWRPLLLLNPFVVAGLLVLSLVLLWAGMRWWRARRAGSTRDEVQEPAAIGPQKHLFFSETESQAYAMGVQLGEEIGSKSIQLSTLGAVEWLLDRNGQQVIPVIARGLVTSSMPEEPMAGLEELEPQTFERIRRLLGLFLPEIGARRAADVSV